MYGHGIKPFDSFVNIDDLVITIDDVFGEFFLKGQRQLTREVLGLVKACDMAVSYLVCLLAKSSHPLGQPALCRQQSFDLGDGVIDVLRPFLYQIGVFSQFSKTF